MKKFIIFIIIFILLFCCSISVFALDYPPSFTFTFENELVSSSDGSEYFYFSSVDHFNFDDSVLDSILSCSFNNTTVPLDSLEVRPSLFDYYYLDFPFVCSNFVSGGVTYRNYIGFTIDSSSSGLFCITINRCNSDALAEAQFLLSEFNSLYGTDLSISHSPTYSGSGDKIAYFYLESDSGSTYDLNLKFFFDITNDFSDVVSFFGSFGSTQLGIWQRFVNFVMTSANAITLISFFAWLFITGIGIIRRFLTGI